MKRVQFLQSLLLLSASPHIMNTNPFYNMETTDSIRLLRHATIILTIGGIKILVDPMLSAKGAMDPVGNCGNDIRIPMVDLPVDKETLNKMVAEADAVLITHTHRDHWDVAAQQLIEKNKFIICQSADAEKIKSQGFTNVHPVEQQLDWKGITINRTGGQHGTGEIGQKMGPVSGFVFNNKKKTIYVAGDTIWCEEVNAALARYKPNYTILNAGGAKFLTGDAITMTPADILQVHTALPSTKIIAVHMDTVNHCFVKRTDLIKVLEENKLAGSVQVPADGVVINV